MAPAAEYSVQNDMGCGLVGALFQRGGSKPIKSRPSPLPSTKNHDLKKRQSHSASNRMDSRGNDKKQQRTPKLTPGSQVVNLAYTQRLRRVPTFTSSELSVTIVDHKKPGSGVFGSGLYRASAGNVMLTGHLGNLKQKHNQKPSKTTQKNDTLNGKKTAGLTMMGNIVRQPNNISKIVTNLGKNIDPEVLKSMGNVKYRQGRYEEALNLYNKAIFVNPKNPCFYSNKSAALIGLSRLVEAVFVCREAIRLDPFYHNAQFRLANLYFRLGEAERALSHYEQSGRKASRKDIALAKALSTNLRSCSEAQGVKDWTTLLKHSQNGLSLGADSAPQIYAMQAEALVKLQRQEEAYAALEKGPAFDAQQFVSLFGSVKTAYFLAVKTQVYMAIGRFEEAVSDAKQAAQMDPSSETYTLLAKKFGAVASARSIANDLFKKSKFAEALKVYTNGIGEDPCNAVLLYNRAVCRSKLGFFEKAIEDCNAALDLRPSYRKPRMRRVECNMKLERWEAAIQDCEMLMQETPGDEEVRKLFSEAKTRLDRQRREDYLHRLQPRPGSELTLVYRN